MPSADAVPDREGANTAPRAVPNGGAVRIWVEELVSPPSALDAFERLGDLPYALLLDSGANPQRLGRYSFLAADPIAVIRSKGARTEITPHGSAAAGGGEGDPLSAARAFLHARAAEPIPGIPPFQCGVAGYLGYDFGATLERLPVPRYDDLAIPDVVLGCYEWVVAWDHGSSRAWIVTVGADENRARACLTMLRERLAGPVRRQPRPLPDVPAPAERAATYPVPDFPWLRSSFTHAGYLAAVARVRE